MAPNLPNDILIPTDIEPVDRRAGRSRAVAFVPITLAVLGIAAILFGGVSARDRDGGARKTLDPIATSSIR